MIEEDKNIDKNIDKNQSLHTLEGDLMASMKNENYASNIVKIVTHDGESDKNTERTQLTDKNKDVIRNIFLKIKRLFVYNSTYFYLTVSIIFILIISSIAFYFINITIKNTNLATDSVVKATTTTEVKATTTLTKPELYGNDIFNADMTLSLQVASQNKKLFITKIEEVKKNLVKNNIKNNIDISLKMDIDLDGFFDKIQYSGPETLLRSLSSEKPYNFGLYHIKNDEFETFFLTKIDIFDLAFSGMLEWERSMPIDFEYIYPSITNNNTSSSSTTPNINKFTDKVIKNIDTRTYFDEKKGIEITYGIINKQYLLITSGENSFTNIVNKLLVRNVLR